MSITKTEVRRGAYYDSVVLMQLQRSLAQLPGVQDAGVIMATPANCELLVQAGLMEDPSSQAGPDDMLIVVKADDEAEADSALAQVDELLARRRSSSIAEEFRPRSLDAAVKMLPEAGWVLISVPGRYAAGVARDALGLGRHVFLYSDNVTEADEVDLKALAQAKGLLLMGPDCGTAIINGVGLGFANRVRRGGVGLVAASGTGLQAVSSRVHTLGAGVSHAIGTGGRDLHAEVDAVTARQGLDILARDPDTQVIVLISKPPAPEVATRLLAAAQQAGKPVVVEFLGYPPPAPRLGNLHFAASLGQAADLAVGLLHANGSGVGAVPLRASAGGRRCLRGLFSGGTLAYEALLGLQALLHPIYSNAPIEEGQRLPNPLHSQAHSIVDLGADEFTVGRLHPMMDNDLRLRRLKQEAADPEVGLILLDVVLGEGAHPDPAAELAPAIADALRQDGLEVAVVVVGTDDDPQDLHSQAERLRAAGARVFDDLTRAVEYAAARLAVAPPGLPSVALERLTQTPLAVINVGLESFHESLAGQGARVVHLDWRPPAGGNEKLAGILAKMKSRK